MMKIRELASGLMFPEGPVAMADGSVILVEIGRRTLTRVTPDGKKHIIADMGGGPKGAAIGPDGAMYVCNNGGFNFVTNDQGAYIPIGQADDYSGGRIERVNLNTGKIERVLDAVEGLSLRGPNDLVFDQQGGLYFTDLGKTRAQEMDRGGVFYAAPGFTRSNVIARPALTANGCALSPDGNTLYFAETEGARLWAFDIASPGQVRKQPWPSPTGARMLAASPGGQFQRFDSMAVDALGNICVATLVHGGITVISADGKLATHVPMPERHVTNICFGGADMRTAFITLSGTGRLIAVDDWPIPGLRLNFNA